MTGEQPEPGEGGARERKRGELDPAEFDQYVLTVMRACGVDLATAEAGARTLLKLENFKQAIAMYAQHGRDS